MSKYDKKGQEFDANSIVDLIEREGHLYCVTAGEVVGNNIRSEVREVVKNRDAKAFLIYKQMKASATTRDERSAAYEYLVFNYMSTDVRENAEGDMSIRNLQISIAELAMSYTNFDRQHLAQLTATNAVRYIVKCFQSATYTIPKL
jgi:hypothetical protein